MTEVAKLADEKLVQIKLLELKVEKHTQEINVLEKTIAELSEFSPKDIEEILDDSGFTYRMIKNRYCKKAFVVAPIENIEDMQKLIKKMKI